MTEFSAQIDQSRFLTNLKTKTLGKRNAFLCEIGSTNSYLKSIAPVAENGFIAVADAQTGGRGRLGKSFESPVGGLYMSVLVKDIHGEDIPCATVKTAVAVCEAVEEYLGIAPESLGIKWVNDILYKEKKLCGILCEFVKNGDEDCLIIGIGLNVLPTDDIVSEEIAGDICGVGDIINDKYSGCTVKSLAHDAREIICAKILNKLEFHLYRKLELCIDAYRDRSAIVGRDVYVIKGDKTIPAHVYGITDDARLCVHYGDGRFEMLVSGDVSIKRTPPMVE